MINPVAAEALSRLSVRDAVFDLMRKLGMTTMFGNPGSTELAFLTPWPADLHYVLALQEASAVAMADAYAQATGNAAFVNLHSAAGLGNGLGTLYTAFRNQSPLIVTGAMSTDILHFPARVLVIRVARAVTGSDSDPGHGSADLLATCGPPFSHEPTP